MIRNRTFSTHKQLETHECILSTVATDSPVLEHQAIHIGSADWILTHWGRDKMAPFPDDTFKCIFLNENMSVAIEISLKFVPKCIINNIPALVQIMAWRWPGDKPSSFPIVIIFFRSRVSEMFGTSYSVTYCIYIPGKLGFCSHHYCAVYDECK